MIKWKTLTNQQLKELDTTPILFKHEKIYNFLKLVGDTPLCFNFNEAVKLSNPNRGDVYVDTVKNVNHYYIVIKPINDSLALTYSIYPVKPQILSIL